MQIIPNIPIDLQEILNMANHTKEVNKGTILFQEGKEANELYLILKGKVQVSKMIADGRELTLRMCQEGDLIGETALFSPGTTYFLHAEVIESGEVAVIFKQDLEKKLGENHELAVEFMKWISQEHRKTQSKLRDLILHGKKGALYSTLIRLSNSYGVMTNEGVVIDTPLTNQTLANFCGTSREVVNRLLSELRKNGIISVERGIITLHHIDFLRESINCDDCPISICSID